MVGVANRVRTIDGMPTMNASTMPPMPASSVIHDGRSVTPGQRLEQQQAADDVSTMPTAGPEPRHADLDVDGEREHRRDEQRRPPTAGSAATARPVQPSTRHTAPTTPATPTPAVKNSKISSAIPIRNSR